MRYYHEKIETDGRVPAKIYYSGAGRDKLHYPLHWHHNLEFDLVLEGCIRGRIDGRPVEVREGEIFFVNSGALHETDGSGEKLLRSVTILLSYELLREYCPDLDSWYFVIEKGSRQQEKLAGHIIECAKIQKEKKEFYELELMVELTQIASILLYECRRKKEQPDSGAGRRKSTGRIKKALSYMEENFENSLSIQDMAEVMSMTPTYFSRFFHQSTGQTFHSYLTWLRLAAARDQLLKADAGITAVALDNGFPNVKAFIAAFAKEYGMTPARYRREFSKR